METDRARRGHIENNRELAAKVKKACHKCGAPLKKGNIKIIRRPGKRPRRVCRKCPFVPEPKAIARPLEAFTGKDIIRKQDTADAITKAARAANAGSPIQPPQDRADGPVPYEAAFDYTPPPRYRYFMTQEQADRVRAAIEKAAIMPVMGVGFEVVPVLEEDVDANPETYDALVEVVVNWKGE